jgi:hypothetical protein
MEHGEIMLSISDTKIMILTIAVLFFVRHKTMESSEVMLVVCSRMSVIVSVERICENTYMNLRVMEPANKHKIKKTPKIL